MERKAFRKMKNLIVHPWPDYELIDSGDGRKLERWGKFFLIRPETQALWRPARPEEWKRANAEFKFAEGGKGGWSVREGSAKGGPAPKAWNMEWNYKNILVRFTVRLAASFKHTGVFPEQAANWEWIAERVAHIKSAVGGASAAQPKILNLFGYTGIASIIAAQAGAQVTHVDASKQSNEWAKENAEISNVPPETNATAGSIRYLLDDALKFVEREVRRGAICDGIILDPPAFGRGAKGEVWHIEEGLQPLLEALSKILRHKPGAFFLLNGYAAGYSPQSFLQATESAFPEMRKLPTAQVEFGELQIEEAKGAGAASERVIPSGIYVRFVR
jgi:23S rRNA (cytosine1962-C5)-methyltransferase